MPTTAMETLKSFSTACLDLAEQFEVLSNATRSWHAAAAHGQPAPRVANKPVAAAEGKPASLDLPAIAERAAAGEAALRSLVDATLVHARGSLTSPGAAETPTTTTMIPQASADGLAGLCAEFAALVVAAGAHGVAPPLRAADGRLVPAPPPPPPPRFRTGYFLDRAALFANGPTGETGAVDPPPPGHTPFTWPNPPPTAWALRRLGELCRAAEVSPDFRAEWDAETAALVAGGANTQPSASAAASSGEPQASPLATAGLLHRMGGAAAGAVASAASAAALAGASGATSAGVSQLALVSTPGLAGGAGGGSGRFSPAALVAAAVGAGGLSGSPPPSGVGWYSPRCYKPGQPLPYASFLGLLDGEPTVRDALVALAAADGSAAGGSSGSGATPGLVVLGCGLGTFNFYAALAFGVRSIGLDILPIMVATARAVGEAAGIPAGLCDFRQGDAAAPASAVAAAAAAAAAAGADASPSSVGVGLDLASLAGARVVYVASRYWDDHLRRAVYGRLLSTLPDGALIIDHHPPVNPLPPGRELVVPIVDTVPGGGGGGGGGSIGSPAGSPSGGGPPSPAHFGGGGGSPRSRSGSLLALGAPMALPAAVAGTPAPSSSAAAALGSSGGGSVSPRPGSPLNPTVASMTSPATPRGLIQPISAPPSSLAPAPGGSSSPVAAGSSTDVVTAGGSPHAQPGAALAALIAADAAKAAETALAGIGSARSSPRASFSGAAAGSSLALWPSSSSPSGYELGPALVSGRSTLPGARAIVADVAANLAASAAQASATLALIRASSPTQSPLAALPAPPLLRRRTEYRSLQPVSVVVKPGVPGEQTTTTAAVPAAAAAAEPASPRGSPGPGGAAASPMPPRLPVPLSPWPGGRPPSPGSSALATTSSVPSAAQLPHVLDVDEDSSLPHALYVTRVGVRCVWHTGGPSAAPGSAGGGGAVTPPAVPGSPMARSMTPPPAPAL